MKKIIIVGYPKSGNTWLTRLTAELVQCPVKGFLYDPANPELAIEGLDRKSKFECYKSHHQHHELSKDDHNSSKIIYIIRDPRDVAISGWNHFYRFKYFRRLKNSGGLLQFLYLFINHFEKKYIGMKNMKQKMNKAVLHGNSDIHYWCRISWKAHLQPYLKDSNILKLKYEDVLSHPAQESQKILEFLGLKRDELFIESAIKNQSFTKRKEEFKNLKKKGQVKFLRKGKSEQWRTRFSEKDNTIFVYELHKELKFLGYPLKRQEESINN